VLSRSCLDVQAILGIRGTRTCQRTGGWIIVRLISRVQDVHIHCGYHLKGEWDNIDSIAMNVKLASVINPERQHDSRNDEELVNTSQASTDGARCIFGDVQGCEHRCGLVGLLMSKICERRTGG
jgi:hypothetical protein